MWSQLICCCFCLSTHTDWPHVHYNSNAPPPSYILCWSGWSLVQQLLLIFMDLTDLQKSSSTKEVKELRVIVSRDGDRNHWSWWSILWLSMSLEC
jgi:hypothetical protein